MRHDGPVPLDPTPRRPAVAVPMTPQALLRTAQRCLRMSEQIATSAFGARAALAEALYEAQFATPAAARTPERRIGGSPASGALRRSTARTRDRTSRGEKGFVT